MTKCCSNVLHQYSNNHWDCSIRITWTNRVTGAELIEADPGFVLLCKWQTRSSYLGNFKLAKKRLRCDFVQLNNLCMFSPRLWYAKFPVISPMKLLFWSMSFDGDCLSVEVYRVEFFTLKHPIWIWEHLLNFFLNTLVCLSFWKQ